MTNDPTDWTRLGMPDNDPPPLPPNVLPLRPGTSAYAQKALESEVADLMATAPGGRNARLNIAAVKLGSLVPHALAEDVVVDALYAAGVAVGLTKSETRGTIKSGMKKGMATPRPVPLPTANAGVGYRVEEVAASELGAGSPFWESRMVLGHLREFALARMASPWAVLGVAMLRALATVPPNVVLPPLIGGHGSLNLFCALVGSSGVGKGSAEAAARDALEPLGAPVYSAPVGSGEGIAHQYAHREKGNLVRDRDAVLFTVSEVDTLTALGQRTGSTLLSQLRSAFSGERLGFGYADAMKRLPIERHTYRLGLVVGVQPERAAPLLDDSDGGTPQRFLWLPATDPAIQAETQPVPPPLVLDDQRWPRGPGYCVLNVPEVAARTIKESHALRARGNPGANPLDGHALFARLKAAQALTLLDGRRVMTEDDWHLSATVMAVSDLTRASITATLARAAEAEHLGRAKREAQRALVVSETVAGAAVERVAKRLMTRLASAGPTPWAEARRGTTSRDREHFDEAVEVLVESGRAVVEDSPRGRQIAPR